MLIDKTIGFIGAGNMAETLLSGLLSINEAKPEKIICSDVNCARLKEVAKKYGVQTATNNIELVKASNIIIYAAKPQIIEKILKETTATLDMSKLVISIAAGIPLAAIESICGKHLRLIRSMPNVCVAVRAGATALAAGKHAKTEDIDTAKTIFNSVGSCIFFEDEQLLDAATGLSGSGPAYISTIMEALADAGVKMGMSRQDSLALAYQTVFGTAKMLLENDIHPGQLKDMVTSPGGTAIAGLHALEKNGIRAALISVVETATLRAKELRGMMMDNITVGN